LLIFNKFKKNVEKISGKNIERVTLSDPTLSARPRLLLATLSFELYTMVHENLKAMSHKLLTLTKVNLLN